MSQTNVCRVKCKFCAFAATRKQEHAYTLTTDELVADVLAQREITGFTELHMVNGESPHVDFDFYRDTIAALHQALPDVHLKCYTASEIHHMTTLSGLTHDQVLRELQAAGLGSLPGGGAEVFADRVRRLVAPGKESFVYHAHHGEEEFLYIVSGRGVAEIGDQQFEVGPGDFMGFPTPSVGHHLRNPYGEDLVYLSGGERKPMEVADFPRHGKRLVRVGTQASVYDGSGVEIFPGMPALPWLGK